MASYSVAGDSSLSADEIDGEQTDPFRSSISSQHRFSHFDSSLFALGLTASPEQAKRALQAHLTETEKRIQEASKLGTTLVQQRKELAEQLQEVEKQQNEGDITPELRQKLVDIEKEYNEVGLDSARAFLPKSRVSSAEMAAGSPFAGGDAKPSISPLKFESQGNSSPSKLTVPSRKQRNQPSNRVHDIEFATEISTSLLSQVRHLQSLLVEKEEALKEVIYEKSRLEAGAEGFTQRLRALDESEQRYKDENWNLETQIHEYLASAKDSADKEKKLTQTLNIVQAEKSATQKELDEIKLSHAKLAEDHAAVLKHHDVELGGVKRNITMAEGERSALQRKVDELINQNQELAKAVTYQRGRLEDRDQARGMSDEDFATVDDNITPEHSPPPSPVKGTPRHSMLESETLKSSLHHAHRMIQNLKGNIHREKTEKLELKHMLQDTRDELESRRNETGMGSNKRSRKVESREFKKPLRPGQLGGLRNSRSELFVDDTNWEEDNGHSSPTNKRRAPAPPGAFITDSSDHQDTTDAFETANERGTETEDFQTGYEDVSGSDELTETEGQSGTVRGRPAPTALTIRGNRNSFQSTASNSGDEYSYAGYDDIKTPTSQPQRMKLKVNRGNNKMSRMASEELQFPEGSPASFASTSQNGTPQPAGQGQSLFAELGDMSDEDESILMGTPSRSTAASVSSTPASRPTTKKGTPAPLPVSLPPVPKIPMVDSGVMTDDWELDPVNPQTAVPVVAETQQVPPPVAEPTMVDSGMSTDPWEPEASAPESTLPSLAVGTLAGGAVAAVTNLFGHQDNPPKIERTVSDAPHQRDNTSDNLLHADSRPLSTSTYSNMSSQYDPEVMDEKLADFPSSPQSLAHAPMINLGGRDATPASLSLSSIYTEHVEPKDIAAVMPPLTLSTIYSEHVEPTILEPTAVPLSMSSIHSEHVDPTIADTVTIPSAMSTIHSQDFEPQSPVRQTALSFSTILSEHVEPQSPIRHVTPLAYSSIQSEHFKPQSPIRPVTPKYTAIPSPKSSPIVPPLSFSFINAVDTEPIEPATPSPKPHGVIFSRDEQPVVDERRPETPKSDILGAVFGGLRTKGPATPIIAEDETRQSPSDSPIEQKTPESQRPFKERSVNTNERLPKKPMVQLTDESSQTALTAEQLDRMLNSQHQASIPRDDSSKTIRGLVDTPPIVKPQKSEEGFNSVFRIRSPPLDLSLEPSFDAAPIIKRPISAGSRKNSMPSNHPPLPNDHKQVIAAAAQRTGSSSGPTQGNMGPPPLPMSAYKSNPSFRPSTPNSQLLSPLVNSATPKASQPTSYNNGLQSPSVARRSRQSSVTSFASEVDNRFNLRPGMMPNGLDPGTDPRMINAITQTMIGEYLWKYTRKAGRGTMSENRHRRYFWVHPYTRTLYWSDRDPSSGGRAELKAKSVPIEAVRVVTDDNPMPPGLHRKSLVIITPGRSVKFTATTGQRHETWFNALSYLLLRTTDNGGAEASEAAIVTLTSQDVDEFNPQIGGSGSMRPPRSSLSSYNSRTTRNDSPAGGRMTRISLQQPSLTQTKSLSSRPALGGTISRLSNYWTSSKSDAMMTSSSSRHSRNSLRGGQGGIYEASEVQDSAEDLREIIEQQDRESDRLENVRACCDGKLPPSHILSSFIPIE
ncbi:hypothetical protein BJ878DRAFT_23682 [Calycina marina]|uniref:PH domain-containing protein n=1 Tax=Calycina marina TaxID=1763456 RepID=A0A9P7Z5M7_9HELO|nr:hypothetical protein BJ878DRAFT_23682 [Calycina marina]